MSRVREPAFFGVVITAVACSAVAVAARLPEGEPAARTAMPQVPAAAEEPPGPGKLTVARDTPASQRPFWKSKPEQRKKLYEARAVLVSVRDEKVETADGRKQVRFTIKGAGLVSAPKAFSFATAQEYPKLKEVSGHFKTVAYHAPSRKLFLVMEALGYQARMVLRMRPVSEDWRDELQWDVVWGDFKGMTGVIGFERAEGPSKTEASIEAVYQAAELPLPKILMGLALEAIAQKVAEKMRSLIEGEYKAASRASPAAK